MATIEVSGSPRAGIGGGALAVPTWRYIYMMMAADCKLRFRLSLVLLAWSALRAAQLPVKTYTTADGLARNTIHCIVQDARGFLWFCTSEGLSRFDGYSFTNYGTEHGLPNRAVNSLLVSRRGIYWAGTGAGLFRLDPNSTPPQKFEAVQFGSTEHARLVWSLAEDHSGTLWVGTYGGLYRLEAGKTALEFVDIGIPKGFDGNREVRALLEDRRGALWIGSGDGLYRRESDGRAAAWPERLSGGPVLAIYEDRQGRIWVGDNSALYRLNPSAGPDGPTVMGKYDTVRGGLPANRIVALLESSNGRFWAGGFGGLGEYLPAADKFESYTTAQGLSDRIVSALAEDNEGNLWLGTDVGGIMKIARGGFTSFNQADGLAGTLIASIFVDQAGELCVVSASGEKWSIDSFDGKRFRSNTPNYAPSIPYFGWGWNQHAFQDHDGEWWVPTGRGLYRFGKTSRAEQLAGRTPKAVYTTQDGLPGNDIFRLFEDSRGDIWIANVGPPVERLTRWERVTGSFRVYSAADGLPQIQHPATAFAEDRSGQLWIGFYDGGLARFRNGHFTLYSEADGLPTGQIQALHLDHTGRMWIASNHGVNTALIPLRGSNGAPDHGGLGRIDNPSEATPRFVVYTTAEGLSNNSVLSLTEDLWGRIYAGTGQGVDRLDPTTGRIKHYTTADGLARGDTRVAARDHDGALWFGSLLGLSRLVPEQDRPASAPPVLITGLQARGVSRPLAEFGQSTVSGLVLQPNQNQLRLDFVGLGFAPGERLRYQYRLEGADRDWSPPTEQRSLNYAGLRPGSYTFHVRALNVEGAVSPHPASITFIVMAPVWQRWWFLSAAGIATSLLIYGLYRYRLEQLLAVERIRTRIATDLHDDIGASLSQVAILSEVVRQRIGESDPEINGPLSRIANVSRELVDSMSDIVWAINPAKDHVSYLVQRMREFANDALIARGIQFEFRASMRERELGIGADARRQVFLIFKECVHNVVRHSNCTQVSIGLSVEGDRLVMSVRDNGAGFEPLAATDGQGLASMRDRARRLGGTIDVAADCRGTAVTLDVPFAKAAQVIGIG